MYAYCYNNPVTYVDPSGNFPLLTLILCMTALAGLGLTIAGVASDNNAMTAIGLTMIAVPALISGGMALFGTTGLLAHAVGASTMLAGVGTGMFASAEYQEAITGRNWMIDAGMSEGWYNGLMLTVASLATLGTFASGFAYSFNVNSIKSFGKVNGSNYKGIKFTQKRNGVKITRSLELHTDHVHRGHKLHWQLNKWSKTGVQSKGGTAWWTIFLKRL